MTRIASCVGLAFLIGCGASNAPRENSGGSAGSAGYAGSAGSEVTSGSGGKASSGGTGTTGGRSASSSGGSAGTGGSATGGGNGLAGAATVLPCDSLGGVGVFENITPKGVTFTQDFVLHPRDAGTLYVGGAVYNGGSGGIFKSTDCGASWVHINTGTGGSVLESGQAGHWTLVIDFADPDVLYTANGYGTMGIFKSNDGGVSWTSVLPQSVGQYFPSGGFVERITMDPSDHLHLLVTPHFACVGAHTGSCMLETKDGGATWGVLDNAPPGGEDTGQMMLDSKHWLYAASDWHLWQTLDAGASWKQVFNGWTTDQDLYRASDGAYYLASESDGVVQSRDGLSWAAIPNSPRSIRAVIGDGTTLFTSNRRDCTACQPYMQAPESNPKTFVTYPSPPLPRGGWRLHYDTSHHLLYSSTETNGLWRVKTR